jgi:hypothetical protein
MDTVLKKKYEFRCGDNSHYSCILAHCKRYNQWVGDITMKPLKGRLLGGEILSKFFIPYGQRR